MVHSSSFGNRFDTMGLGHKLPAWEEHCLNRLSLSLPEWPGMFPRMNMKNHVEWSIRARSAVDSAKLDLDIRRTPSTWLRLCSASFILSTRFIISSSSGPNVWMQSTSWAPKISRFCSSWSRFLAFITISKMSASKAVLPFLYILILW